MRCGPYVQRNSTPAARTHSGIVLLRSIRTTEYYSAPKKNEIRPFVATELDLEEITLREVSQTNIP